MKSLLGELHLLGHLLSRILRSLFGLGLKDHDDNSQEFCCSKEMFVGIGWNSESTLDALENLAPSDLFEQLFTAAVRFC
jgi:hypothetical protein